MPCLRWQKRYENEETAKSFTEYPGLPGPYEGPGPAPGPCNRADAADHRQYHPVSVRLGMALGFPGQGRPASTQHADTDANRGELHCGCGFHRERLDRRGPERNPGRVAK